MRKTKTMRQSTKRQNVRKKSIANYSKAHTEKEIDSPLKETKSQLEPIAENEQPSIQENVDMFQNAHAVGSPTGSEEKNPVTVV